MLADPERSKALHSGEYVERYNRKSINRVAALAARMRIRDADLVADYACGNGMLLQVLGDRTGTYSGVDFSEDFIASGRAAARKLGLQNYSFYCQDIIQFCSSHPSKFDVATTLDFSEHIDDRTFIEIFSAVHSSLRPGGRLFLHTPNRDFFMEILKEKGVLKQFPEHIAVRTVGDITALLQRSGFAAENIRVELIPHYNILKVLHPLRQLPWLGKYFAARIWLEATA